MLFSCDILFLSDSTDGQPTGDSSKAPPSCAKSSSATPIKAARQKGPDKLSKAAKSVKVDKKDVKLYDEVKDGIRCRLVVVHTSEQSSQL